VNLRELVDSWRKILLIVVKPVRDEYTTILKITLLGFLAVGLLAFIIRVIFYTFLFPYVG
jgi:protein transport protein SEC61 subunit gamma-like protein